MRWTITDIHGAVAEATFAGSQTTGAWEHCNGGLIYVVNGTPHDFRMCDVAQKMVSINLSESAAVGATVHVGASGLVEGTSNMPWSTRLTKCLDILAETAGSCVAVMDAPPSHEITGALAAVELERERIRSLQGTEKLLLMSGLEEVLYPMQADALNIVYSTEPWDRIRTAPWGSFVLFLNQHTAQHRMRDAFALLLGTYTKPSGPHVSTAAYPTGATLPSPVFPYMSFSDNVVPGSARASTTRGMSATTTDGEAWTATVIMQYDDDDEELPMMQYLRDLLTTVEPSSIGSAYFSLCSLGPDTPAFVRRALADTHAKAMASSQVYPPPSMCRVASHHSPWH